MPRIFRLLTLLTALVGTIAGCHKEKSPFDPKADSTLTGQVPSAAQINTQVIPVRLPGLATTSYGDGVELPTLITASDQALRFLVFGDSGTGTPTQYAMAKHMQQHCQEKGCAMVVHTGDIIYPKGIASVEDPQTLTGFEGPYAPLGLPVYLSLGNHDYYGNAEAAIAYTKKSPWHDWILPGRYYTFLAGGVRFVALDTDHIDAAQAAWAIGVLTRSRLQGERMAIAFGHHPRQSFGAHGMPSGPLGHWLDQVLCYRVDAYLAGHDHDLQVLTDRCGVRQIISGAAAQIRPVGTGPGTEFAASELGFLYAVADIEGLHLDVLAATGAGTEKGQLALRKHVDLGVAPAPICRADGLCYKGCTDDPDCKPDLCLQDGVCQFACTGDPDCAAPNACSCDRNPMICDVRESASHLACGCDPACQRGIAPCGPDLICDPACDAGRDPDCR